MYYNICSKSNVMLHILLLDFFHFPCIRRISITGLLSVCYNNATFELLNKETPI